RKDWLVIFFVHEIDILKPTIQETIDEIEKHGCGNNTIFYLVLDSVEELQNGLSFILSVRLLKPCDSKGSFCFDDQEVKFKNEDKYCWKEAFKHIFSNHRAKRTLLMTLSHGAAFGINRDY